MAVIAPHSAASLMLYYSSDNLESIKIWTGDHTDTHTHTHTPAVNRWA